MVKGRIDSMALKKQASLEEDKRHSRGNLLAQFENEEDDMGSHGSGNKSDDNDNDHRTYGIKSN